MTGPALPIRAYSRAVLIGTSTFQHAESLPWLPAVNNNVTDLAAALTDAETGVLDPEHCTTVYTPDSPRSLLGQLRPVAKQAEDLLVVYYAGHGLRDLNRDTLYLAVRETDPDELDGTAVPYESLREIVAASPARTKLLILDCCYSGMAIGRMSSGVVESDEVAVRGTSVITSSPRNKKSLSPPGERHTAFTAEVLSLLKNGPRIPGRQLDVAELFRSVTAAMARRDLPEPKMSTVDTAGLVVLRRAAGARPPATPPDTEPVAVPEPRPRPTPTSAPPEPQSAPEPSPPPVVAAKKEAGPDPRSWSDVKTAAVGRAKRSVQPGALLSLIRGWGLWIVLVLCGGMGIGGVVGGILAKTSDLSGGIPLLLLGIGSGALIRRRLVKARKEGNPTARIEDAFPALGHAVDRVRTPVLVTVIVVCLVVAITGATQPLTSTSQWSPLAVTAGAMASVLLVAAGCGWVLYRRVSGGGSAGR